MSGRYLGVEERKSVSVYPSGRHRSAKGSRGEHVHHSSFRCSPTIGRGSAARHWAAHHWAKKDERCSGPKDIPVALSAYAIRAEVGTTGRGGRLRRGGEIKGEQGP